ncbi:MAG: hypothetical protein WA294_03045 [Acidobacteriaceae bacterium]
MSIIDPITGVDGKSSPISLSQCYQKNFLAFTSAVDAVLPAAIAGAGSQQAICSIHEVPAMPQVRQKDAPSVQRDSGRGDRKVLRSKAI